MVDVNDIQILNRWYLTLLRAEAKIDPNRAAIVFGVPRDIAERIAAASLDEIEEAARSVTLVFRPRSIPDRLRKGSDIASVLERCATGG